MTLSRYLPVFTLFLSLLGTPPATSASTGSEVQARIDRDLAVNQPIVVHVVVALCDNQNQGIVPVPPELGNGQSPRTNLYWGALYGVKTHLSRAETWQRIPMVRPDRPGILDRVLFRTEVQRGEAVAPMYLVADAWDGARIKEAIQVFLEMSAGREGERLAVPAAGDTLSLPAGGHSHAIAFVGHDGLMEFDVDRPDGPSPLAQPRSAMVLACISKTYFLDHLEAAGAHPLLLTTGLMAPEAYTLEAALLTWCAGGEKSVVDSAAEAYHRYQRCGLRAARNLFFGKP